MPARTDGTEALPPPPGFVVELILVWKCGWCVQTQKCAHARELERVVPTRDRIRMYVTLKWQSPVL